MSKEQAPQNANNIVRDSLSRLDVDAVGVASIARWKGTKLEETALRLLPRAKSVVAVAMEVYPEIVALASAQTVMGAASLTDLIARNGDYLNGRLTKAAYDVAKASHSAGLSALPLPSAGCPLDNRFLQAAFSYKHASQAAGLGRIGWSSLLITPHFGPRVRLACCLTEAELEPTKTEMSLECEKCGICIESCPAKALSKPRDGEQYNINKFACNAYRSAAGGCSECVRLCPASA